MDDWQIELVKGAGLAVISFVGGFGTYWLKNRAKQKDADRVERERQVQYDEFKKMRRLIGGGEVEQMERAAKLTELIIKHREHEITVEQFSEYRDKLIAAPKRTKKSDRKELADAAAHQAASVDLQAVQDFIFRRLSPDMPEPSRRRTAIMSLAIIDERGPNKNPVGFDAVGNKVEWNRPSDDDDTDDLFFPMMLFRNEDDIYGAMDEMTDKVWYGRHGSLMQQVEQGKTDIRPDILEGAKRAAERMERKYGKESLAWDGFEWGMISGKLSALRWVTGSEWDFLDT